VILTDLDSVTVSALRAALDAGTVTSRAVVAAHLERIARLDGAFGAIRCLAPDALDQADASDRVRRERGPRSPIEGIPVLIKDNIDIAGLPMTAGALALEHWMPTGDATIVAALRAAGAVILGKTNLSELANFLTEGMPSGYSSLGGQVLNPYDASITPSGSSSGSGTAAALALAPLTVGTETDGSITSPAVDQSLVGMKPTLGLVSRTGILPVAASQDTAGPMTRTVADALALLAVLAGPDPTDEATALADDVAEHLRTLHLHPGALTGVRLSVVRADWDNDENPDQHPIAIHQQALAALAAAGAVLSESTLPTIEHDDELTVLHYEFGLGVDRYLATRGSGPPHTLADIQAWNREHAGGALKFGQAHVDTAVAIDHERDAAAYRRARERDLRTTSDALEAALGEAEALVFASNSGCSLAARAGWPSIVVPAGYTANNRRPLGLMLVGRPWTDARLLALAYAFEQAHPARRPPEQINPAAFRRFA
jgi:amidase